MAAGLGFKTFTTGEVLTAADVNGYLMQGILVFANAAARSSAITSPQEGQYSFLKDTNALEYYDGAAWVGAPVGDITAVTAGTGISGGGSSGAVTITNDMATTITASGDIVVGTGNGTYDNLPIGTTGQVLTADTTVSPYKVKWATAASGNTFVGVSAARDASFSVSSATATAISLNSTDQWDTDSIHNPSVNPTRFTIPTGKGGYWSVNIGLLIAGQTSSGAVRLLIYKNGASWLRRFVGTVTANVGESEFAYSEVINVAAGDYIEFYVWQNVWSSITCYCATNSTGEKQGTAQLSYLGA